MIRELVIKLRKAADVLEDLTRDLNKVTKNETKETAKKIKRKLSKAGRASLIKNLEKARKAKAAQ